ncbi:MAG: cobalamin-binding protein [Bacteroidetes bacterium]|nr:MAG: cobalamin-binding protein [Bacteroidota bacterium]TAE58397.1 MAG: cobalamin-binding protein [Bacteroidota bacterium]
MIAYQNGTPNSLPALVTRPRIVSLVPSLTALLHNLGCDEEVVGITKFCVHPTGWLRSKTIVGGTKDIRLQKVLALQPTLILANKEENLPEPIQTLGAVVPVWVTDVVDWQSNVAMITQVGQLVGKANEVDRLVEQLNLLYSHFSPLQRPVDALYLIWRNPYMSVGNDTFIHAMLEMMGVQNICQQSTRYPTVQLDNLPCTPSVVLLSSEPYPFKEKHIDEIRAALPQANILLVNGEYFSWYGSKMLEALPYLQNLVRQLEA